MKNSFHSPSLRGSRSRLISRFWYITDIEKSKYESWQSAADEMLYLAGGQGSVFIAWGLPRLPTWYRNPYSPITHLVNEYWEPRNDAV